MGNLSEALLRRTGGTSLCTGVAAFDEDLAAVHKAGASTPAGLPEHTVTELSGLPGTGKTAVALALIFDAVRRGQHVLYVGCDYRGFPWERIRRTSGWSSERYDNRIHTVYIDSIEQLLTLQVPAGTGLVVIEHYNTLIKRAWQADVRQRASKACIARLSELSLAACVLTTSGCLKTLDDENVVVPKPAVIVRNKPENMARVLLYKDQHSNYVLSTGVSFTMNDSGLMSGPGSPGPSLRLPELTSRHILLKHTSLQSAASPQGRAADQMLTPASKRSKTMPHQRQYGIASDPPSSPSSGKGRRIPSSPGRGELPGLPPLGNPPQDNNLEPHPGSPVSMHSQCSQYSQHSHRSYQQAGRDLMHTSHASAAIPAHEHASRSQTLAQDTRKNCHTTGPDATGPVAKEHILGLEIVPSSQLEVEDPDYVLKLADSQL